MAFSPNVNGDDLLVPKMKDTIARKGLTDQVGLGGAPDFSSEPMPRICGTVDLFVCCRSRDTTRASFWKPGPAACRWWGMPKAFEGLVRHCPADISVPMNDDPKAVAAVEASLARDPRQLLAFAQRGLELARQHTFEREFGARIDDVASLLGYGVSPERSAAMA